MYAGAGRAGDFAGDPLKTAAGFLAWLNAGQTSLRAEFGKTLHIPATAKMIYYKTNAIIARNAMSPKDQTVSAGVVPTLTAIAIPAGHEDGSYNPMPATVPANLTEFSTGFSHNMRGYYRVEETALERYELYRGVDAEPDLSAAAYETFASLPHDTPAQAASHTYYFVLRKRNKYNLCSQNIASWSVKIDAGGANANEPSAPVEQTITPAAGGTMQIGAAYNYLEDAAAVRADTWAVWLTSNGSAPDPATTPTYTVAMAQTTGRAPLAYTSSAFGGGLTIKALVRARRAGTPNVDSANTASVSAVADATGPAAVTGAGTFLGLSAEQK
jgi:hypothetical protein